MEINSWRIEGSVILRRGRHRPFVPETAELWEFVEFACVCVHEHMRMYVCIFMYACMCVSLHAHACVWMPVHAHGSISYEH